MTPIVLQKLQDARSALNARDHVPELRPSVRELRGAPANAEILARRGETSSRRAG